ncbi:MAG: chemotaxis protein CheW [Alphaproteobacteria bacterium]|nr:chemotaxis protein CheW [Alphaproteobacteria bacterium]MDD9920400.1 chemotaxis protein CheW [Alphaproteobacteria bacterium]
MLADTVINGNQFLTFTLQEETYGVDILKVQEIRGWSEPTPIPNAPEFIRGVMNLRGEIVPILDMRRRFQMDETSFTKYTVIVVVNVRERTIGMTVDAVSDVMDITVEDMKDAPDFGTSIDASFIRGLAASEEKMVILLDIDAMLQSCELVDLDKIVEKTEATV